MCVCVCVCVRVLWCARVSIMCTHVLSGVAYRMKRPAAEELDIEVHCMLITPGQGYKYVFI